MLCERGTKVHLTTVSALTIRQPWAALLVEGSKWYEYRPQRYATPRIVAIHAGKGQAPQTKAALQNPKIRRRVDVDALPYGAVIALGRLSSCQSLTERAARALRKRRPNEVLWGAPYAKQSALRFDQIRPLSRPVPATGKLGLWRWVPPASMRREIERIYGELKDPLYGSHWEEIGGIAVDAGTVAFGDAAVLGRGFRLIPSRRQRVHQEALVTWSTGEDSAYPVEVVRSGRSTVAARICFTNDVDDLDGWWVEKGRMRVTTGHVVSFDPYCRGRLYEHRFRMQPGAYVAEVFSYASPELKATDDLGLRLRRVGE
jgi:hypothetical protein